MEKSKGSQALLLVVLLRVILTMDKLALLPWSKNNPVIYFIFSHFLRKFYLLDLALILLSTKLLGIITKKFKMPQVVGALLAGLIFGPAMLNILKETNFIIQLSELGVILLMFSAGLDTDLNELKKTGKASFIIALFGVLIPLIGGFLVAYLFSDLDLMKEATTNVLLQNIFIGVNHIH